MVSSECVEMFKRKFQHARACGRRLTDLDMHELAGYYLELHKGSEINCVSEDIRKDRISAVVGYATKSLLEHVLGR